MVPEVFGRRMSDGKAVVIRPPQACRGETTANGLAPPDLLPMVIVYDNADNLAFGTAYMSEDAYESPHSVLSFGGATIDKATRLEFEEFRRTEQNVLTHEMYRRLTAEVRNRPGTLDIPMWGANCYGYARYRLPDDLRDLVRTYWPQDKPRYWQPPHDGSLKRIWGALSASKAVRSDGMDSTERPHRDIAVALEWTAQGLRTRRGGGQLRSRPVVFPPAVYPDADGWGPPPWPRDQIAAAKRLHDENKQLTASVDFRNGTMKGFAYCRALVDYFVGPPILTLSKAERNRVDDQIVEGDRGRPIIFVERDEFIFQSFEVGMFTGAGDS
jgi:hypothetical protein